MKKSFKITLSVLAVAVVAAGCATGSSSVDLDKLTAQIVKASFRDQGIVKASVLDTDETNQACSAADVAGKPLDEAKAKAIEAANLKTVKWPESGKFLGDWKEGEKLAQSGRGLTWTDDATTPNGGNCYNCHQITKQEISFGTIGPSLYNYGKLRGVTDPASAAAKPIVEYTWGKVWNSKAYNACSNMPRAGHMGILTQAQVADILALLLDPKSPVNQ
ncbi:MAG TPA: sulfur oxidation c-type cytochrome SoxX [Burkholderiaceae bacterium]|nr:sulfur oxidation c-type cytochrome SoxX [Rhodoferax sp.]MBP7573020.1 sulfur oxidation c-type cytochrome SoxX [Rhodoferax sp.]HNW02201.1 sulfur oxidation c-type cytochrome SoxX [Burkholderiaceae bacterium]HPW09298.1 sulfur oxidation c-type cytochrome SoxX [Burkholderiaceae bacterium]